MWTSCGATVELAWSYRGATVELAHQTSLLAYALQKSYNGERIKGVIQPVGCIITLYGVLYRRLHKS